MNGSRERVNIAIEILPDARALAQSAADRFIEAAEIALREHGRFAVVLSGGSTPREMNRLIAEHENANRIDWTGIFVFWSDERCVPPDHVDSNYRMACETLLDHVPIPSGNVYRMMGEWAADHAAVEYEERLRAFFASGRPRFDFVVLGLGLDGHIASLFPGSPGIEERRRWAIPVKHDVPPPPLVDRVTLTPPVLNLAAEILFLVAGSNKAECLSEVMGGSYDPRRFPGQIIQPRDGSVRWLLDEASAEKIT